MYFDFPPLRRSRGSWFVRRMKRKFERKTQVEAEMDITVQDA